MGDEQLLLVADDNATTRMLMRAALEPEGFSVIEASNGVEALAAFEKHRPDAVLLDMYMPELDGISVCEKIKEGPGAAVPVLIFTASDEIEIIHRAYNAGATDFLSKPFKYPVLPYHVRYMIRSNNAIVSQHRAEVNIARLGQVIENSSNEIYIFDRGTQKILQINNCSKLNLGYGDSEIYELSMYDLSDAFSKKNFLEDLSLLCENERSEIRINTEFVRKDGTKYPVEANVYFSQDNESSVMFAIVQNITQRKADEEQMRFLAYHDSLTSLPNRQALRTEIAARVQRAILMGNAVSVLFIDIDNFKSVNDELGHDVGDDLLVLVAQNLMRSVRDEDVVARLEHGNAINIARLGGDEFTVVLLGARSMQDAQRVAERILAQHNSPITIHGHRLSITTSIGIAAAPADGSTLEELIKHADIAMRSAKQLGKNTFAFCDTGLKEHGSRKLKIEQFIETGLRNDEFEVVYQPIISVDTKKTVIAEALARWHHPQMGGISPGEFIPIAEESGKIIELTLWVFRRSCVNYHEIREHCNRPITISINISVAAIRNRNLPKMLADVAIEENVPTSDIILELTENVMMTDSDHSLAVLSDFSSRGFCLALDDFGSGYSSFAYLLACPFHYIKIDRMFVTDIESNINCKTLIQAIADMAKALKLRVIAEGFESETQLELIAACDVDFIQGFLMSPPLNKKDFLEYIITESNSNEG